MARFRLTRSRIAVAVCLATLAILLNWGDPVWESALFVIWWVFLGLTVPVRWPSKDPADYR